MKLAFGIVALILFTFEAVRSRSLIAAGLASFTVFHGVLDGLA